MCSGPMDKLESPNGVILSLYAYYKACLVRMNYQGSRYFSQLAYILAKIFMSTFSNFGGGFGPSPPLEEP